MGFENTVYRLRSALKLSYGAFGHYKSQIITLVILGTIGGLAEGLGINALIPLFSFATGEGTQGVDFISRAIAAVFSLLGVGFGVRNLLILIMILFAAKALATVFISYVTATIQSDYEAQTRYELMRNILRADWQRLARERLGSLETVVIIDTEAAARLLYHLSRAITVVASTTVYIIVAINISLSITLIALIAGLIIFLMLKPILYRVHALSSKIVATNKDIAHHISENVLGLKAIKVSLVGDAIASRGGVLFDRLRELLVRISIMHSVSSAGMEFFGIVFITGVFAYSYKLTDFNFGSIVAIIYLIHRIFTYVQQLQRTALTTNQLISHVRSVIEYRDAAVAAREDVGTGVAPFMYEQELAFDGVSFTYEGNTDMKALDVVSFSVARGEFVGIIGPSGAGKSTLVDMVLRLLDPIEGEITLDGAPVSSISIVDWRKNIGYVPQDIFLIDDTVANNIRFFNDGASDADIEVAARQANIHEFIVSLPQRYATMVGDRGGRFSVGQRQRIAIARALLRKPKILILDEATSALDVESEAKIHETLTSLRGRVSIIAIAHRLSTVTDSDRLIVLDGGRVVEIGSPRELLRDKDSYFFRINNVVK